MVEAEVGVEPDGCEGDGPVFGEEGVCEGEHGVDGVAGRAAVAVFEGEVEARFGVFGGRGLQHAPEVGEVGFRGHAFDAEQGLGAFGRGGLSGEGLERVERVAGWVGVVAAEHGARVEDFGVDEAAGELEAGCGFGRGAVLGLAQADVLVPEALGHAVEPAAEGEVEHGDVPGEAFLDGGRGQLRRGEQAHLRSFHEPGFLDDLAANLDDEPVALLADDGAVFLHVEGQGVVARGHEPAHAVLLRGHLAGEQRVGLVGQADGRQRAAGAFGAVAERGRARARVGHGAHLAEQFACARDERLVQRDGDAAARLGEVDFAVVAGVAVFAQDEALRAHLHALGLVRALGEVRRGAALHVHGHGAPGLLLDEVDPRDEARIGRGHEHGARLVDEGVVDFGRRGLSPVAAGRRARLGEAALFPVHAAMLKPAIDCVHAVGELGFDPFEPAQPRTIGILVQHPRRDQVGGRKYRVFAHSPIPAMRPNPQCRPAPIVSGPGTATPSSNRSVR